jgi:hypothetical protein
VDGVPLSPELNVVAWPTCAIGCAARQARVTVVGPVPVTVKLVPSHVTDIAELAAISYESVVADGFAGLDADGFADLEADRFARLDAGRVAGLVDLDADRFAGLVDLDADRFAGLDTGLFAGLDAGLFAGLDEEELTAEDLRAEVLLVAGRRAIVPETEFCEGRCGQLAAEVGPEVAVFSTATATSELPVSLTVVPRLAPFGAWATMPHALLPWPKTSAVPAVSVVTVGDALPAAAAEASTGLVVLTPEKAMVAIETWVGGLTDAEGSGSCALATVMHAAS